MTTPEPCRLVRTGLFPSHIISIRAGDISTTDGSSTAQELYADIPGAKVFQCARSGRLCDNVFECMLCRRRCGLTSSDYTLPCITCGHHLFRKVLLHGEPRVLRAI